MSVCLTNVELESTPTAAPCVVELCIVAPRYVVFPVSMSCANPMKALLTTGDTDVIGRVKVGEVPTVLVEPSVKASLKRTDLPI